MIELNIYISRPFKAVYFQMWFYNSFFFFLDEVVEKKSIRLMNSTIRSIHSGSVKIAN